MRLVDVPEGKTAIVKALHGGYGALLTLREMGINEDSVIKIVRKPMIGPIIVEVNGTKIAIGRGLASKVEVDILN